MSLAPILEKLKSFVYAEHRAGMEKLLEIWEKPLHEKLTKGDTQKIDFVEYLGNGLLEATLGRNESKLREGDMICLHLGEAHIERIIQKATIEAEDDGKWLLRAKVNPSELVKLQKGCFADPDGMDLTSFYDKALSDVATSNVGRSILLPLLNHQLDTDLVDEELFDTSGDYAQENGLNEKQCEAVSYGVASKYVACIQGPPGTGKTKVISLIAKLLVKEGQRVFLTSHTHMAINNALNKIAEEDVPVIKVCASGGNKALSSKVKSYESGSKWEERPDGGYVIGATPFATCSDRLENFDFDTVIFDEASQITLPLALMAMRKAKRYVFVGDHKQLPPVILSQSVLAEDSAFSKLIAANKDFFVRLGHTYRMSQALTNWPSKTYYKGDLVSKRSPEKSTFNLPKKPSRFSKVLSHKEPFIFIKTPGINKRSSNSEEAKLVADIVSTAIDSGLRAEEIGIVTPYRAHAKALKSALSYKIGLFAPNSIVTDTVERMQGQEREMIIIAMCSSDPQFILAIAEFFFQSERLNVAITRPQTKLVLIGPEITESFALSIEEEKARKSALEYRSLIQYGCKVEI
ncbi:DEAD/DEAH box helicase [Vibrio coralliilyticus]|uniref:AAA family ATPase n=1 Tax=Vibrio coralliilyticus TaxID=190893 RepID=A0AAP6ZV43_9VIBR|nr:AAA domain-containing protein [Vibrio coralliilyticus]NOJ26098.1 AAA family ATPase [Vibrio coralliilyticus]